MIISFSILSSYSRPDVLALGKYTLNLIGCSKDVAKDIYQMVEYLVSKVTCSSLCSVSSTFLT